MILNERETIRSEIQDIKDKLCQVQKDLNQKLNEIDSIIGLCDHFLLRRLDSGSDEYVRDLSSIIKKEYFNLIKSI